MMETRDDGTDTIAFCAPHDTETASSPSSSTSTLRPSENGNASPHRSRRDEELNAQYMRAEWHAKSISAPPSRTASFSGNLDHLAVISQSAHRFPVKLPAADGTRSKAPLSRGRPEHEESQEGMPMNASLFRSQHGRRQGRDWTPYDAPNIASSRSTPVSPRLSPRQSVSTPAHSHETMSTTHASQLHHGLQTLSSGISRSRGLFSTGGSGFTPATPSAQWNIDADTPRHRERQARGTDVRASMTDLPSPPTSAETFPSNHHAGRARSTTASQVPSAGIGDSIHRDEHTSVGVRRRRALSARTSPALQPLQPLTPVPPHPQDPFSLVRPQNTHSVPQSAPHFTVASSYLHPLTGTRVMSNAASSFDESFALPPPIAADGSFHSSHSANGDEQELPPPYTPAAEHRSVVSASEGYSEEAREVGDDPTLDFVARRPEPRRRARSGSFTLSDPLPVNRPGQVEARREPERAEAEEQNAVEALPPGRDTPSVSVETPNLAPDGEAGSLEGMEHASPLRRFALTYLLHPLRLLAIIPGCVGTFWLLRNAIVLYWTTGAILQRTDGEAFARDRHILLPSAMEFAMSSLWSLATMYHALSFTTLLLRRWLHYYSLVPSLIRLVALQAICWPLVRVTLHLFGPQNPLPAWSIISSTTAFSDTVARWVVSNITDEIITPEGSPLSSSTPQADAPRSARYSALSRNRGMAGPSRSNSRLRRAVRAFWRTIMGAPPRQRRDGRSHLAAAAERGFFTESEAEGESDAEGLYRERASGNDFPPRRGLRHRRVHGQETDGEFAEGVTSGAETEEEGTHPPACHALRVERVGRIFHWDVAFYRNFLPICVLAYLTMAVLFVRDVRLRWY